MAPYEWDDEDSDQEGSDRWDSDDSDDEDSEDADSEDADSEDEDPDSEDPDSEDTDREDTDDSDDWAEESDDSGYIETDDEEDEEDGDIRPHSPLNQELAPEDFWQGWRQMVRPVSSVGASPPLSPPGPSWNPQSPEDLAPSTSGLGSSLKRSREESSTEQVSSKRPRTSDQDPAPSTSSGLRFSPNRRNWHVPSHHTGWSDDSDSD
ncbi:uncharacterized protein LOC141796907 [Halichoeres trimaculatus]|uniref:uncharacterized protein LOC141796907 n=1 Tax=Halichoeres trimaculatus TaxID=147232 RepID=UPI003D9F85CE